jgi:hypothetical protein
MFYYVSFSHFDLCLRLYGCLGHHDVIKLIPFCVIILALCDDVHLCYHCIREFLILSRTWFAFGLPSKTGCDRERKRGWAMTRGEKRRKNSKNNGDSSPENTKFAGAEKKIID